MLHSLANNKIIKKTWALKMTTFKSRFTSLEKTKQLEPKFFLKTCRLTIIDLFRFQQYLSESLLVDAEEYRKDEMPYFSVSNLY